MTEEQPRSPARRWAFRVFIALLIVAWVCVMLTVAVYRAQPATTGDVTGVTEAQRQPAASSATPLPEPSSTPLPGVGDEVSRGGISWTVLEAEALGSEFFGDRPDDDPLLTAGVWVRVLAQVGNTGAEPFSVPRLALADGAGREFAYSSDAIWRIPNERLCSLETVNPGLSRQCEYVFEVPADAAELQLIVKEPGAFGERAAIDLGLP